MIIKYLPLLPLVILTACSDGSTTENATEVGLDTPTETVARADAEFQDPLVDKVFQNYLTLRSALVDSDQAAAATAAGNMADTFTEDRAELRTLAQQIADAGDLEVQREHFRELTGQLGDLLESGLSAGTIYRMHCPMAFDGEGGDWYSEVDQVRNPYYGEKMLTCGKVEETIQM
ncbi:hypothetical protein GGR26_001854 [Lewinella marina]|uniref:DUF3347 domain-containing protein n=1 Tax=Neolewinella marina TaxID=438751 RepID=A0A2G0CHJ4_9BACT|nr:DUF3347 domain-containing protein [Neolewinella marina]NJB86086.1 hypothetical protein [Neolewinella marina]PHK99436.1 hypothetical protein CGL56_08265 [Neolewinella marina]